MNPIGSCMASLAVAILFYIYRGYRHLQARKRRVLQERVAYLLWVAANQNERRTRRSAHSGERRGDWNRLAPNGFSVLNYKE